MKRFLAVLLILDSFHSYSQADTIWFENFNDTTLLPVGFSQHSFASDGGWLVNTEALLGSTYFNIPPVDGNVAATNDDACNCDKSADTLFTPVVDLSGAQQPYLMFNVFYFNGTFAASQESLKLLTSSDGGNTWMEALVIDGSAEWQTIAFDLGASGGDVISFAFVYSDGNGWLYGAALDNLLVVDIDPAQVDASLSNGSIGVEVDAVPTIVAGFTKYIAGENMYPVVSVTNEHIVPITSLEISCEINGNVITESVSNISLFFGEVLQVTFSDEVAMPAGTATAIFEIQSVNGIQDINAANNITETAINGINIDENKLVVAEQLVSTTNGWSPRGYVFTDYLEQKYPNNFIALNVHSNDAMAEAAYETTLNNQLEFVPQGLIDRADYAGEAPIDPADFEKALMNRISSSSGVQIDVSLDVYPWNAAGVICDVHFDQALTGTYKMCIVLVEDQVSGVGNGFNQMNMYSNGSAGAMGGYENLPQVIPASQMEYNHVVRSLIGTWQGSDDASVSAPAAGSNQQWSFAAYLNENWNQANLRAVALLINSINGEVVNAGVSDLFSVGVETTSDTENNVQLFPNPAFDKVYVKLNNENPTDVTIKLTDSSGRMVYETYMPTINTGEVIVLPLDGFENGFYTITVVNGNANCTMPLMVRQ